MPAIPVSRKQRQGDSEFEFCTGYIAKLVSKQQQKIKQSSLNYIEN
jgi:hypothetical protein